MALQVHQAQPRDHAEGVDLPCPRPRSTLQPSLHVVERGSRGESRFGRPSSDDSLRDGHPLAKNARAALALPAIHPYRTPAHSIDQADLARHSMTSLRQFVRVDPTSLATKDSLEVPPRHVFRWSSKLVGRASPAGSRASRVPHARHVRSRPCALGLRRCARRDGAGRGTSALTATYDVFVKVGAQTAIQISQPHDEPSLAKADLE